jgi:hypothetical protein
VSNATNKIKNDQVLITRSKFLTLAMHKYINKENNKNRICEKLFWSA